MIQIIKATKANTNEIVLVFEQYRQYYGQVIDLEASRKFILERLTKRESVIFLALENDKPIGFTQLYPIFSSVTMERMWLLNDLFVTKTARNQGVGESLLMRAQDFVYKKGHKGLLLQTEKSNFTAQKLYEKLGWENEDNQYYYYFWKA
jgi:GNAT superfamily N-acetyltransferase